MNNKRIQQTVRARSRGVGLVLALGAASVAACSLALSSSTDQCLSDADCRAKGGPFADSVCTSDRVCAPSSKVAADAAGGPPALAPDSATTSEAAADGPSAAGCQTNAKCNEANAGAPTSICRKDTHVCVDLLSQDCAKVVGDVRNDDVVILGTLNQLSGANQSSGTERQNAEQLAIEEFTQTVVGIPGGLGGKPRPLAFVSCSDVDDASRAARHLVEQVGVPAIVGAGNSGLTVSVAQNVTIPAGVFLIAPSATSPTLTGLADDGLLWRTAPSDVLQAIPIKALVSGLEAEWKGKLGASSRINLAVLFKNDTYGQGLSSGVLDGLQLNGEPISSTANKANFYQSQYDATAGADLSPTLAALLAAKPHIVVLIGTTEVVTKLLTPIESTWPTTSSPPPRPTFVVSDGGKKSELLTAVTGNDDLRKRVRGTAPGRGGTLTDAFGLRYQGRWGASPAAFGTAGAYDAAYLVVYSMVAGGGGTITGASIASGMKKMVGGTKLDVGPAKINDAFQVLRSGNALDFDGASGPLDFDVATGDAPSDIDVWCVTKDTNSNGVFQSSGEYYRASDGKVVGTYACP